jgi:hypothetical protein
LGVITVWRMLKALCFEVIWNTVGISVDYFNKEVRNCAEKVHQTNVKW